MKKTAIIGCGNLGSALAKGLLSSEGFDPETLILTKRNTANLEEFAKQGVTITADNLWAASEATTIVLCVKPYTVIELLEDLKTPLADTNKVVISAATSITLSQMEAVLGTNTRLLRAMPNTAAGIGESITALCANTAGERHLASTEVTFSSLGPVVQIQEQLMDAATILGACGIAYALRFIRAMIQGGIEIGFDAATATTIASQTVKGAAELLIQNGTHPESEIDKVTTPKGCTITGLNTMEHNGFSSALIQGIVASHKRIE